MHYTKGSIMYSIILTKLMITTKITSWEREMTTQLLVRASVPARDYSLLIAGSSGVGGDGFRRSIPVPAECRNRNNLAPKTCRRWRRSSVAFLEKSLRG